MSTNAPSPLSALGICLEEYEYPYSVQFLPLTSDLQPVTMAYWTEVIPDCGHVPHLEQPGPFLAELLPFLARENAHQAGH